MKISLTTIGLVLFSVGLVLKIGYLKAGATLIGFDILITTLSYFAERAKMDAMKKKMQQPYIGHHGFPLQ